MAASEEPLNWMDGLSRDLAGLQVALCSSIDDLIVKGSGAAAFVTNLNIRVAEYHDIQSSMLIYDGAVGTLAIVHGVARDQANVPLQVRAAVDSAVSLRQIVLELAERNSRETSKPVIALQVEAVLVLNGTAAEGEQDPIPQILSDITRNTGYLRLVGLSVLEGNRCGTPENESALRRAFPWLLSSCRSWFESPKQKEKTGGTAWRAEGESFRLETSDYRLRGERSLQCEGACALHLLHGHNGSGKSTYTEALEFLATNRIERVEDAGEKNYFLAVRHRRSGLDNEKLKLESAPQVRFFAGSSTEPRIAVSVSADGALTREGDEPTTLRAKSFRLDSVFLEKLARGTAESRALMFLDAFSPPEDAVLLEQIRQGRRVLRESVAALPSVAREVAPDDDERLVDWILREFSLDPSTESTALFRSTLLSFSPRETELLARICPSVRLAASATPAEMDSASALLLTLLPDARIALQTTHHVFTEFQNWTATGQLERGESIEHDLDRWLDLQAQVDLNSKYLDVVATLAAAEHLGWMPSGSESQLLPPGPFDQELPARLEARKAALANELNDARARVQAWQQQSDVSGVPPGSPSAPPAKFRNWLTPAEVAALNRASAWMESAKSLSEPLGEAFARALREDMAVGLGKCSVGSPPGLDVAIAELQELLAACDKALLPGTGAGKAQERFAQLAKLATEAASLKTQTAKLTATFFQQLAGGDPAIQRNLKNAFNELLALLTPARWNYRDLELQADVKTGKATLGVSTQDGARADLLLNTAELNAWTLSLFLLLSTRLPNPLRLLILDDPLQNMDELSVVTLARGLGRLMRIFPKGWMILGFFHGEENIEMIRQETECHVYHLPWLQSRMESAEPLKKLEGLSTAPAALQKLDSSWFAAGPV